MSVSVSRDHAMWWRSSGGKLRSDMVIGGGCFFFF